MIDSTDFKLRGKNSTSVKSKNHSYKNNAPSQRYMFINDGKNRIRKYWGGYSPKMHDLDCLKILEHEFEKHLDGGVILADFHFFSKKNYLKTLRLEPQY